MSEPHEGQLATAFQQGISEGLALGIDHQVIQEREIATLRAEVKALREQNAKMEAILRRAAQHPCVLYEEGPFAGRCAAHGFDPSCPVGEARKLLGMEP